MTRRVAIASLLALFLTGVAAAEKPAPIELGFKQDKVYSFGSLDNVNLFNGNMIFTIPLGMQYPVSSNFSYGLTLVYNSKAWDYFYVEAFSDPNDRRAWSKPNVRSNAGMGWRVSLGRLIPPAAFTSTRGYSEVDSDFWTYEGTGGEEHSLACAARRQQSASRATPAAKLWMTPACACGDRADDLAAVDRLGHVCRIDERDGMHAAVDIRKGPGGGAVGGAVVGVGDVDVIVERVDHPRQTPRIALDYAYDGSGNIKSIGVAAYAYDPLQRLVRWTQNGADGSSTWNGREYDRYGNPLYNTSGYCGAGGVGCTSTNGASRSLSGTTNRYVDTTYDAAGNVTADTSGRSFTYDGLGMATRLQIGTRQFRYLYTVDDERIAAIERVVVSGVVKNKTTYTIRGFNNQLLAVWQGDPNTNAASWVEDEIYRGTSLLARESATRGTTHYFLDHLGSPRAITSATGTLLGTQTFTPWGGGGTVDGGALQFTGHERDAALYGTGNTTFPDYMHARYYDVAGGRFLAMDPGGMGASDPQTWNRYSYARNSPLRYTDPDGRNFRDYVTGVANGFSSSLLYNINRVNAPNAAFAVGQAVGDGIALVQSVYETVQGATIAGGSGLVTALSGGTSSPVSLPAAAGGATLAAHGATSTPVALSNLQSQMSKVRGLEKQVKAHEQKLADYKKNPDAHGNKGFLKNKTREQRENIIESRIRSLQHQIDTFKKKIESLMSTEPK